MEDPPPNFCVATPASFYNYVGVF